MPDVLTERIRVLEVKIDGNGSPGVLTKQEQLEQRVNRVEDETLVIKEKLGNYVTDKNLRRVIREEITAMNKGWGKYIGPVLTGIAALLMALGNLL